MCRSLNIKKTNTIHPCAAVSTNQIDLKLSSDRPPTEINHIQNANDISAQELDQLFSPLTQEEYSHHTYEKLTKLNDNFEQTSSHTTNEMHSTPEKNITPALGFSLEPSAQDMRMSPIFDTSDTILKTSYSSAWQDELESVLFSCDVENNENCSINTSHMGSKSCSKIVRLENKTMSDKKQKNLMNTPCEKQQKNTGDNLEIHKCDVTSSKCTGKDKKSSKLQFINMINKENEENEEKHENMGLNQQMKINGEIPKKVKDKMNSMHTQHVNDLIGNIVEKQENTGLNHRTQISGENSRENNLEKNISIGSPAGNSLNETLHVINETSTCNKHVPYISNSQIANIVRRVMKGSPEHK